MVQRIAASTARAVIFTIVLHLASAFAAAEIPVVNTPHPQRNWANRAGHGSCVHASFVSLLRWNNDYETAAYWRKTYAGGENPLTFHSKLNKEGIRYSSTVAHDNVQFLEWTIRTRRGCLVSVGNFTHAVALVHLDKEWAGILDNNSPNTIIWIPRQDFLTEWHNSYSWAVTPIYSPIPALPAEAQPIDFWTPLWKLPRF